MIKRIMWVWVTVEVKEYIEKTEEELNEKGEVYRRMVQKGFKEVEEQEGREIGLNERGVK